MGSVQLNNVGDKIKKHTLAVVEDGTVVDVKGLPGKPDFVVSLQSLKDGTSSSDHVTTMDVYGSPYLNQLLLGRVIEQARQAEQEGYDAFVIGSYTDPFLKEMRSIVDIPVISTAECNVLLACSYGKLQGHICLNPSIARLVTDHVRDFRLTDRVAGVYSLGEEVDEWTIQQAWEKPDEIIARFTELAHKAIAAGADVIIPAEGIITEFIYAHGITRIGKAPVFDSFGMAWKYAELLVNLRKKMNLTVGREWEYRRPTNAQLEKIKKSLNI